MINIDMITERINLCFTEYPIFYDKVGRRICVWISNCLMHFPCDVNNCLWRFSIMWTDVSFHMFFMSVGLEAMWRLIRRLRRRCSTISSCPKGTLQRIRWFYGSMEDRDVRVLMVSFMSMVTYITSMSCCFHCSILCKRIDLRSAVSIMFSRAIQLWTDKWRLAEAASESV